MESKELINNLKKRDEWLENEAYQLYDIMMDTADGSIRHEIMIALRMVENALLTVRRLIDNLENKEEQK